MQENVTTIGDVVIFTINVLLGLGWAAWFLFLIPILILIIIFFLKTDENFRKISKRVLIGYFAFPVILFLITVLKSIVTNIR